LFAAFHDARLHRIVSNADPLGFNQQWQLPLWNRIARADLWHAPYYVRPFLGLPRPIVTVFDVIGRIIPDALPSMRSKLLFELTLRCSLMGAAQIITSSNATKRDLIRLYGLSQQSISVIPLAADAQFRPQSVQRIAQIRANYDLPDSYLLYFGSNKPHKNLPTLIRAFAAVKTDQILVIAGRWDRRYPQAKQLAVRLGLTDRVRFLHDVDDADAPAVLAGASAFVFPSRYEGFGLPPLEAMACGTPVITTNVASLPEVVGDAGLLVAPDVEPLRDAIQTLADDALLRDQLRDRGLERAAHFSWRETARQTVAVYEMIYEKAGKETMKQS
jgi:alpha-1,3-rhamnosyl/mannosyltransferase